MIREWMTRPDARMLAVRDAPRLPWKALSELRSVVDSFLQSGPTDGGIRHDTNKEDPAEGTVRPARAGSCPEGREAAGTAPAPGKTSSGSGNLHPVDTGGRGE